MLGVTVSPPRRPEQTARLRKAALPGVGGTLNDVAALLAHDAGTLQLKDVTPEAP
ncbi:hypothetical protein [Sorangium sp. So ce542]|uniref:hypothetical protein n=1 Tax=Sorangium sp. So ce542 TaxID=3133316 RepID=UPI003F63C813